MADYLVLVADGSRARILSLEPAEGPRARFRLEERADLVNPEHELPPHERFTGGRSESRGHVHGHWYGTDDHRTRQDDEHVRRFAARAAAEALHIAREARVRHLAIVAPAKMLGFIRSEGTTLYESGLDIRENTAEVAKLPIAGLEEYLSEQGLLSSPTS